MTNAIEQAVSPLKQYAMDCAEKEILAEIADALHELEAADMDAEIVAPYPKTGKVSRTEYMNGVARYKFICSITKSVHPSHKRGTPRIVAVDPKGISQLVEAQRAAAAHQFEKFVYKLNTKIPNAINAKITTISGLWGESLLEVTTTEGNVETWKTQIIFKRSKLGKLHNQWPARKVHSK